MFYECNMHTAIEINNNYYDGTMDRQYQYTNILLNLILGVLIKR